MAKPQINLDFRIHWCPRHLEPFRIGWPGGAGVAMVRLAEAALSDERIAAAAPHTADGQAKAESLDAVLLEYSPLCCFVGEEKMQVIYAEVGKRPPR